jgi:hypothetical protein
MIRRRAPELDRELYARSLTQLIGVQPGAETAGSSGGEHGSALIGIERSLLAERVDPPSRAGDSVDHLVADQRDVVVGAPFVLGRNDVGREQRRLRRLTARDLERTALVGGGEPVAGLDLE